MATFDTMDDFDKFITKKLARSPKPTTNPLIERLKRAAANVRASKAKYN